MKPPIPLPDGSDYHVPERRSPQQTSTPLMKALFIVITVAAIFGTGWLLKMYNRRQIIYTIKVQQE
jgi:hypothetical protein